MTDIPRIGRETSHQTALAGKREGVCRQESGKVFVIFLRSCVIRSECQSKINKRFGMVPCNFEKVSNDKAVPL